MKNLSTLIKTSAILLGMTAFSCSNQDLIPTEVKKTDQKTALAFDEVQKVTLENDILVFESKEHLNKSMDEFKMLKPLTISKKSLVLLLFCQNAEL